MVTRLPCVAVVTELSIVKKKRKKFTGIPFSFLIWLTVHLTAFSADESSAAPYFAKSAVYGVRSSSQSMDISSDSDPYDRTPDHRSRRREAHRRPGRERARGNGREIDGRTVDISEKISTLANTLQVLCASLRHRKDMLCGSVQGSPASIHLCLAPTIRPSQLLGDYKSLRYKFHLILGWKHTEQRSVGLFSANFQYQTL